MARASTFRQSDLTKVLRAAAQAGYPRPRVTISKGTIEIDFHDSVSLPPADDAGETAEDLRSKL